MSRCLVWFFGRGASVACRLCWTVPGEWYGLGREILIDKITGTIKARMDDQQVDTSVYKNLLCQIFTRTDEGWKHLFVTTNWDYLLQREISRLSLRRLPKSLMDSHVYHLNGSVESCEDPSKRSQFLLETDPAETRKRRLESNSAFNKIMWQRSFIVIGMSMSCATDKRLLIELSYVEDDLPIGESDWTIINPNNDALESFCHSIGKALPRASIKCVQTTFEEWIIGGMSDLVANGIFTH